MLLVSHRVGSVDRRHGVDTERAQGRVPLLRRSAGDADHATRRRSSGSSSSRSRRPGRTSGSRRARGRSCRRPATTRRDGSSTSTTPDFRAAQEQAKYDKLIRFAEKLPELRATMAEHLDNDELDRERVSAIALRLINLGWFRVGSERYARESRTYGITTLTQPPCRASAATAITLAFRGKHKIQVRTTLVDEELAAAMRELLERPKGARVFRVRVGGRALQPHEQAAERLREALPGRRTSRRRTSGPGAGRCSPPSRFAERAQRHGFPETKTDEKRSVAAVMRRVARAARKYAGGLPRVIRLAGGRRSVSRRANDRGFPAPPFARRRRARTRPRRGGAGAPQPAPLLAHSAGARGRVIPRSHFR